VHRERFPTRRTEAASSSQTPGVTFPRIVTLTVLVTAVTTPNLTYPTRKHIYILEKFWDVYKNNEGRKNCHTWKSRLKTGSSQPLCLEKSWDRHGEKYFWWGANSNIKHSLRNLNVWVWLYAVYAPNESETKGAWRWDERNEDAREGRGNTGYYKTVWRETKWHREIILRMVKRDRKIIRDK
jgi:hypothetical protein